MSSWTKVQDTLIPYDSASYIYDDNLYYDNTTQYDKVVDTTTGFTKVTDTTTGFTKIADKTAGFTKVADTTTGFTKVADKTAGFTKVQDTLIIYDSTDYTYDADLYYDNTTQYTKVADKTAGFTKVVDTSSIWISLGGLIHLATEGLREFIITEGPTDYIVISKGVESGTWTDVSDTSTSYTKVSDK